MTYKIMIIDDRIERTDVYTAALSDNDFELLFVGTRQEFEANKNVPVDGYIVDVFLDKGDWNSITAADLIDDYLQFAPRLAPVFLVSGQWGDLKVLDVYKRISDSSASVLQFLAWSEFKNAVNEDDSVSGRHAALTLKIHSELSRWHGHSGFRPEPDDTVRVLLLADPQFGDPKTDASAAFAEHWIAKSLLSNASKHEDEEVPDLIVLAGDITYSGRPDQFALAKERLEQDLIGPLWGYNNIERMRDRIIVTPGNHDVNLRFSSADKFRFSPKEKVLKEPDMPVILNDDGEKQTVYPSHQDYALMPFRNFAYDLTKQREWRTSKSLSWVDRRFLHCGFRFITLNSVAELDSESPDLATFCEKDTRAITRSLADDDPDSIFTIAVSHHALPESGEIKETGIANWKEVGKNFFSLHKIRMWIYGHYHKFDADSNSRSPFHNHPLWLVQLPTTRIYPTMGFAVLELKRSQGVVVDATVSHFELKDGLVEKADERKIFG